MHTQWVISPHCQQMSHGSVGHWFPCQSVCLLPELQQHMYIPFTNTYYLHNVSYLYYLHSFCHFGNTVQHGKPNYHEIHFKQYSTRWYRRNLWLAILAETNNIASQRRIGLCDILLINAFSTERDSKKQQQQGTNRVAAALAAFLACQSINKLNELTRRNTTPTCGH